MRSLKLISAVAVYLIGSTVAAQEPDQTAEIKRSAEAALKATKEKDHAGLVELTHPKLVAAMGGKETMIARLKQMEQEFKRQGFDFSSLETGKPGNVITSSTGRQYVVVPTQLELETPQVKLKTSGFLLGISEDQGENWKFVDGNGLSDPAARKKLFSDFPDDLKLPPKGKPIVTRKE